MPEQTCPPWASVSATSFDPNGKAGILMARTPPTDHTATTRYQPAWAEYLAECSCGWVGSYWRSDRDAVAEARAHEAAGSPHYGRENKT